MASWGSLVLHGSHFQMTEIVDRQARLQSLDYMVLNLGNNDFQLNLCSSDSQVVVQVKIIWISFANPTSLVLKTSTLLNQTLRARVDGSGAREIWACD